MQRIALVSAERMHAALVAVLRSDAELLDVRAFRLVPDVVSRSGAVRLAERMLARNARRIARGLHRLLRSCALMACPDAGRET